MRFAACCDSVTGRSQEAIKRRSKKWSRAEAPLLLGRLGSLPLGAAMSLLRRLPPGAAWVLGFSVSACHSSGILFHLRAVWFLVPQVSGCPSLEYLFHSELYGFLGFRVPGYTSIWAETLTQMKGLQGLLMYSFNIS